MNYRHAYHAGNFADVLKHVVLIMLVEHLKKKPAPFFYLDTHAGRGRYDLSEAQAQRSGEYKEGIGRLLEARSASLPPEVAAYVALVRDSAGKGHSAITAYPGSPLVVARLRRPDDRLVLMETLPKEASALEAALGRQRQVSVIEGDGYAALKAQLPPRENRGLVLIDPPYESDLEFDRVLTGLELAHERWPTGMYCIWYPLTDRAGPVRFHRDLKRLGHPPRARRAARRAAARRAGGHGRGRARDRQPAVAARRTAQGVAAAAAPTAVAGGHGLDERGVAGAGVEVPVTLTGGRRREAPRCRCRGASRGLCATVRLGPSGTPCSESSSPRDR